MKQIRMASFWLMTVAAAALAGVALAALAGSKHDFTSAGDATGAGYNQTTEKCKTCHIPHQTKQNTPLWGHTLSTATYQLYKDNASYTGGQGAAYDATTIPGSTSGACLSCHDGTVASVGSVTLSSTNATASWLLYEGGARVAAPAPGGLVNLKANHPVTVNYTVVQGADTAGYQASPTVVKLEGTPLRVQCGTCHEAHNKVTGTKFLHEANTGSALCLRCHIK